MMLADPVVIDPERVAALVAGDSLPTPGEARAFEHAGRMLARRALATGATPQAVFSAEFAGRTWTFTERPDPDDAGGLLVTLSFGHPDDTGEG